MAGEFTPAEQVLVDILQDGDPHMKQELIDAAGLSGDASLNERIKRIRKKLPRGITIVAQFKNKSIRYRMMRLIGSSAE